MLGKDLTENLLAEEEELGESGAADGNPDVLAGLHKQIRVLSHGGSPGSVPHTHLEPIAEASAGGEEGSRLDLEGGLPEGGAEELQGIVVASAGADEALPAKTPRATASLGYADSHNPATMAILRSGGTTRLLADTLHARRQGGTEAAGAPAASGDAAPTGRTNGTTRLLADMTMASSIGARLRAGASGATPQGVGRPSGGLADFSLEEFDPPPELPAGGGASPASPGADLLSSPAPSAAGYPVGADLDGTSGIPGGPKLARTPVSARPGSLPPRSAQGTPASWARSQRSQRSQQPTPATVHSARTPGSAQAPAASYPMDIDASADGIPGGPKLARTPVGRTPATAHRAPPGSAVAQHHPGSALGPRYPGSAIALHRGGLHGGLTPLASTPPMTFQARQRRQGRLSAPAALGCCCCCCVAVANSAPTPASCPFPPSRTLPS